MSEGESEVLQDHAEDVAVVTAAMHTLFNRRYKECALLDCPTSTDLLVVLGGIHLHDECLQYFILSTLMMQFHNGHAVKTVSTALLEYIYEAMDVNVRAERIQFICCRIIRWIAENRVKGRQRLLAGRAVEVCNRVQADFPKNEFVIRFLGTSTYSEADEALNFLLAN